MELGHVDSCTTERIRQLLQSHKAWGVRAFSLWCVGQCTLSNRHIAIFRHCRYALSPAFFNVRRDFTKSESVFSQVFELHSHKLLGAMWMGMKYDPFGASVLIALITLAQRDPLLGAINTAHFVRRHAMARALREIDRGDRDIELSKMKCHAPYALLTATQRNAVLDAEAQTMGDQIDQLDRMIQEGPQWCHKD